MPTAQELYNQSWRGDMLGREEKQEQPLRPTTMSSTAPPQTGYPVAYPEGTGQTQNYRAYPDEGRIDIFNQQASQQSTGANWWQNRKAPTLSSQQPKQRWGSPGGGRPDTPGGPQGHDTDWGHVAPTMRQGQGGTYWQGDNGSFTYDYDTKQWNRLKADPSRAAYEARQAGASAKEARLLTNWIMKGGSVQDFDPSMSWQQAMQGPQQQTFWGVPPPGTRGLPAPQYRPQQQPAPQQGMGQQRASLLDRMINKQIGGADYKVFDKSGTAHDNMQAYDASRDTGFVGPGGTHPGYGEHPYGMTREQATTREGMQQFGIGPATGGGAGPGGVEGFTAGRSPSGPWGSSQYPGRPAADPKTDDYRYETPEDVYRFGMMRLQQQLDALNKLGPQHVQKTQQLSFGGGSGGMVIRDMTEQRYKEASEAARADYDRKQQAMQLAMRYLQERRPYDFPIEDIV